MEWCRLKHQGCPRIHGSSHTSIFCCLSLLSSVMRYGLLMAQVRHDQLSTAEHPMVSRFASRFRLTTPYERHTFDLLDHIES